MKNRVAMAINGRMYTLVSDESVEYMTRLADYINDKISEIRKTTDNTMGERPVVLALLNISDELFKTREAGSTYVEQAERVNQKMLELAEENRRLHELFDNNEFEIDIKTLQAEVDNQKKIIAEKNDRIRHLENSIQALKLKGEKDMEFLKKRYER